MSLSTTLECFKKTLLPARPHAERIYAAARSRHRALAPYETIGAVLTACARGSRLPIEERDAIFAAIITELQSDPDSVWQSLILVTFTPMIVRIRGALRGHGNEDLDSCVLLAFLETARTLPYRTYVARNLWSMTRARLFAERRREHRAPELLLFDDETYTGDVFRAEALERAAAAEVIRVIEAEGGDELREVFLATSDDECAVSDYVARAYADCDEHIRARIAKRLRRARLHVLAKLRARSERHSAHAA